MKKSIKKKILIGITVATMAAALSACSLTDLFGFNRPDIEVTYYGCPNSKKVRKLNLKKR